MTDADVLTRFVGVLVAIIVFAWWRTREDGTRGMRDYAIRVPGLFLLLKAGIAAALLVCAAIVVYKFVAEDAGQRITRECREIVEAGVQSGAISPGSRESAFKHCFAGRMTRP